MKSKRATVAKPFSASLGYPIFDFGDVVSATKQGDGLYTVTRFGHRPSNATTVVDVPGDALRFTTAKEGDNAAEKDHAANGRSGA